MSLNHGLRRVLLIEDDREDCEVFAWAIKDVSHILELDCCSDCLAAPEKIATFSPDIIFLDLKLPYKNGLQYLEELAVRSNLGHVPVVIYSSQMNPLDVKEAARLGAKIYFEKPHSYTELVDGLKDILSKQAWESYTTDPVLLRDGVYLAIG